MSLQLQVPVTDDSLVNRYILNYLDRNNIAAARLAGLEDELQLHGTQYQTAVSILFVGYLLMQVPSNLFLNKIGKPRLYLPTAMIVWGTISAATGAVNSFGGLVAVRFFLGFVEACYFPGCLYYLSAWYTRKELGFRTAMLYSGSLISGAFSGLIAAGITKNMDGTAGLRAWRWLFIIEGCVTIAIAFGAIFVLPNFPRTTPWLSPEEKELAVWRLDEDIGEDDWVDSSQQTFWHGLKLAVKDIKMWIMVSPNSVFLYRLVAILELRLTSVVSDGHAVLHCRFGFRHQLFSHRGSDAGLRRHRVPALDRPTLCLVCHHCLPERLARRPHGRTLLPRHDSTVCRCGSFHSRRSNHIHRSQVCGHDVDGAWCVHWVRRCIGLDLQHDATSTSQARRCACCDQRRVEH
jgi:MFS family permease